MENLEPHIKTIYKDEVGNEHHLEVNIRTDIMLDIIYHCVIDGDKNLDIQMVGEKWKDLANKNNSLAENMGMLIEHFSE